MSIIDKINGTQEKAPESKETTVEKKAVETKETTTPKTLEDVISSTGHNDHDDESKKAPKSADDDKDKVIVSLKRELKENRRETKEIKSLVTDLTNLIESDKKSKLSDAKIVAFAEKRGVDPDSIRDLAELLRDEVAPQETTKKVSQKGKPTDEDEDNEDDEDEDEPTPTFNTKRLSGAVDKLLADFLEEMPEYENVVDEDTVKELILSNPAKYTKLNMGQIVEKIYGKTITGKKGVEKLNSTNREKKEANYKGKLSSKEFESIKDDPEAKKEYRSGLLERARKFGI